MVNMHPPYFPLSFVVCLSKSLMVIETGTNPQRVWHFLLVFHCNYGHLYQFSR